jgi:NAD(P)-dependent dehydrogenase (short-subunit alcohol dehydrogenase family)
MPQTILVTGSTSGFGRLIAETLARQGYIVFASMRAVTGKNATAAAELRALAQQEHLALHVIELDATDDTSVEQAIERVIETTGRLDVVVNNVGVSYVGPIEAFSIAQVQQLFDTNVFSVWRVNHAALPHMRRQGSGLLLHIGSNIGRVSVPFLGLYGATKFALEGLTESYRQELALFGIDAVIVEPGTYPTAIGTKHQDAAHRERLDLYQDAIDQFMLPFNAAIRAATPPDPQEVADVVAGIIAQPAGERPLRTVVAATVTQSQAPQAINEATANATQSFFDQLALPLTTLRSEREK